MLDYTKVIFVSQSDTARGPLAAEIMKQQLNNPDAAIESRGLVVLFPEPLNPKMVAVAASKGIDFNGKMSQKLEEEDFGPKVLVLVMDEKHKKTVYEDYTNALNVYTIKEFIGELGDVEDPYGGELSDYGYVYESLYRLTEEIINKLQNRED